jgi:hypothetical protein
MATKQVTISRPVEYIDAAKNLLGDGETVSGLASRLLRSELVRRSTALLVESGWYDTPDQTGQLASLEDEQAELDRLRGRGPEDLE